MTSAEQNGPSKRMVRLTFNQVANSIRALLGNEIADSVAETFEISGPTERSFPPLAHPREGSVFIDTLWQQSDNIAQNVGQYVLTNFASVTGCGAEDHACARSFVMGFAERAYRRPLSPGEQGRLGQLVDTALSIEATPGEVAQYGVYAVLEAPQFLYRTEFGNDPSVTGPLTLYEVASALSFFLTDAPPDDALLLAAAAGQLSTREQIAAHVTRLMLTEATRINLQSAMLAYFGIPNLDHIIIDPQQAPSWNDGLRNSMYRESELFLNQLLWNGSLSELLTSRQTFINDRLAALYGVSFPPAGSAPDADGFALAELPETRSGVLTQAGFLTSRSRPDVPSVVGRGLLVLQTMLCIQPPAFPEDPNLLALIEEGISASEGMTEREKALQREEGVCGGCHKVFDAYGIVLDNFDIIGSYRTTDPQGRPIDASWTMPANAGGNLVQNASEMAHELIESGSFTTCMAKNLIGYALAEGAVALNSCATQNVVQRFVSSGDHSFSSLIHEVAASETLSTRNAGVAQ